MNRKTIPNFLFFLCMGFGDAVGPFVSLAKKSFQLSNAMAQLIPFVGFAMFGLLSIPMGIFQDKRGKRTVLLGAGATILQVAGNPIMRDVSEPGKYTRNLSLGQAESSESEHMPTHCMHLIQGNTHRAGRPVRN